MPVYLFTYHAYGSWMPDHPRGYVVRHEGIHAPDEEAARDYRREAAYSEARFTRDQQRLALETCLTAAEHLACRVHTLASDPSHMHLLASWVDDAVAWEQKRNSFKRAITLVLKQHYGGRRWFSRGASRKRVLDQKHFDHLATEYLPDHRGWKWDEQRGFFL